MFKINYQSDFTVIVKSADLVGDFIFMFSTFQSQFTASRTNGEYVNCKPLDNGDIKVIFKNHGLKAGKLKLTITAYIPNPEMGGDMIQKIVTPTVDDVELVCGAGDTTADIEAIAPFVSVNAYDVWLLRGNVGTEDEYLASLKGEDYVLTQEDKQEIAGLIDLSEHIQEHNESLESHAELFKGKASGRILWTYKELQEVVYNQEYGIYTCSFGWNVYNREDEYLFEILDGSESIVIISESYNGIKVITTSIDNITDAPQSNIVSFWGFLSEQQDDPNFISVYASRFESYNDALENYKQLQEVLPQAKSYTDEKIAKLIGTAPEMLDTLEEIAKAIQEGGDTAEALNKAITEKLGKDEAKSLYVALEGYLAYTQDEKSKLAGLSNYDDSQIKADLAKKATAEQGQRADFFTITFNARYDEVDNSYTMLNLPENFDFVLFPALFIQFSGRNLRAGTKLKYNGREFNMRFREGVIAPLVIGENETLRCVFDNNTSTVEVMFRDLQERGLADISNGIDNGFCSPKTIGEAFNNHNVNANAHPELYGKMKAYVDAVTKDTEALPIYFLPNSLSFTRPTGAGGEVTISADTNERVFYDKSIPIGRGGQVSPNNLYWLKLHFRSVSSSRITNMRVQYFVKGIELINEVNTLNNTASDFEFGDFLVFNRLLQPLDYVATDELRIVLSFWVSSGTDTLYLKAGNELETSALVRLEPISTGVTKAYVDELVGSLTNIIGGFSDVN